MTWIKKKKFFFVLKTDLFFLFSMVIAKLEWGEVDAPHGAVWTLKNDKIHLFHISFLFNRKMV